MFFYNIDNRLNGGILADDPTGILIVYNMGMYMLVIPIVFGILACSDSVINNIEITIGVLKIFCYLNRIVKR